VATPEELAPVRDRLFGLVQDEQIRQVAITRPDPRIIKALLEIEDLSSIISDAMDQLGVGGRVPATVLTPIAKGQRICGPAVTIRYARHGGDVSGLRQRKERPALGERDMYALGKSGDIGVFDCGGWTAASVMGAISARWARRFGIAGCVVDGSVRDVEGIEALGVPVWSRALTPASGNYRMIAIEVNGVVSLGGVVVAPGDLIVADGTGICVVPIKHVEAVVALVQKIQAGEKAVTDAIDAGIAPLDVPKYTI
jgi:4-hydroxy-4-methyl-2-oxoglutarate aldolase